MGYVKIIEGRMEAFSRIPTRGRCEDMASLKSIIALDMRPKLHAGLPNPGAVIFLHHHSSCCYVPH